MRRNMQSKRKKPWPILLLLLVVGAVVALMNYEPALVQTPHEQTLDASALAQ